MRLDKAGKTLLIGAASATLLLTGCGSSGTISSLTDSDQTASIAVETAVEVATEVPADTAGGNGNVASVPEIVPQTIVGTPAMSVPDLTVGTDTPAADSVVSTPATVTDTAPAAEGTGETAPAPVDEEISLLGDETATEEVAEASETEVETEEPEETEETEEGETEEEEESSEEGGTAYITGDEVNVREEPTTDNGDDNVMFTLLEGDEVKILDREDNWVKISVDGEVGWVSSAYVE
jgi:hypothetical protein